MARLFELEEENNIRDFSVSNQFKLTESTPSRYNILRLLCGGIKVTNLDMEEKYECSTNYMALYYAFDNSKYFEENLVNILSDSLDVPDLETFFFDRKYNLKNKEFFKRLENELCNFLTYQAKGSYTTAFIFIYRILEVISYSFPLIYASSTYDFKHTFGKLREMFDSNTGKQKGELGFFKSAINVMFKDSALLETSIDFQLNDEHVKNEKIFKAIKAVCKDSMFHEDTVVNSKISINFGDLSSFIITLRNRFFHLFNRGDKNLESIEVIDPDYFFSKINEPVFSWICVVYIEVNKFLLQEFEKYVR